MALRLLNLAAAASALAIAGLASSAMANDGRQSRHSEIYSPARDERDRWVEECSERLTASYHYEHREDLRRERDRAWDNCESYYDDYYAYYRDHRAAYAGQHGATLIPSPRKSNASCACTQEVEYEYEYVEDPARPAPRPRKRVKVVPDKRIRLK